MKVDYCRVVGFVAHRAHNDAVRDFGEGIEAGA